MLVSSSYTFLYIFCNFGQKLTDRFELFEDVMCKCQWYLFPIEMQQTFAFVMMNVQQSATVKCFGNIELNRETSKQVNVIGELQMLQQTASYLFKFFVILDVQNRVFSFHDAS